jgi:hypothetical protein
MRDRVLPLAMRLLNRSAVIVQAKEPMLAWLRSVDPTSHELTLAELREEPTVYLLPECEDEKAVTSVLKKRYRVIFEEELEGWYRDRTNWPEPLTFRLFQSWFDISFHSMIEDTCDSPLMRE